jgi:23S rRNA (guanine1835-N2)-methyltransferase
MGAAVRKRFARNELLRMKKPFESLKRYPFFAKDLLQAYDSADELILNYLSDLPLQGKRILILNDSFGALSANLSDYQLSIYTDSFVSAQGIIMNSETTVSPFHDLSQLTGIYDFVIYRVPKNLSFFEDELARMSAHLGEHSQLIGSAMVKHLPKGAFDLLEKYIGKVTTSLAQKKARLLFTRFEKGYASASPYPLKVSIENFSVPFVNASNLFSREKLDIGTRFFLEHIPRGKFEKILDLGCANGIVGIRAKQKNPEAQIIFSDESAMAIESAKTNYKNYFTDEANFVWTNCYERAEKETLDLVLCNPPFHQQATLGDFIAQQMAKDSFHALKKGAKLRVIGNSHLQYPQLLKSIFRNSKVIATHPKFVICEAQK